MGVGGIGQHLLGQLVGADRIAARLALQQLDNKRLLAGRAAGGAAVRALHIVAAAAVPGHGRNNGFVFLGVERRRRVQVQRLVGRAVHGHVLNAQNAHLVGLGTHGGHAAIRGGSRPHVTDGHSAAHQVGVRLGGGHNNAGHASFRHGGLVLVVVAAAPLQRAGVALFAVLGPEHTHTERQIAAANTAVVRAALLPLCALAVHADKVHDCQAGRAGEFAVRATSRHILSVDHERAEAAVYRHTLRQRLVGVGVCQEIGGRSAVIVIIIIIVGSVTHPACFLGNAHHAELAGQQRLTIHAVDARHGLDDGFLVLDLVGHFYGPERAAREIGVNGCGGVRARFRCPQFGGRLDQFAVRRGAGGELVQLCAVCVVIPQQGKPAAHDCVNVYALCNQRGGVLLENFGGVCAVQACGPDRVHRAVRRPALCGFGRRLRLDALLGGQGGLLLCGSLIARCGLLGLFCAFLGVLGGALVCCRLFLGFLRRCLRGCGIAGGGFRLAFQRLAVRQGLLQLCLVGQGGLRLFCSLCGLVCGVLGVLDRCLGVCLPLALCCLAGRFRLCAGGFRTCAGGFRVLPGGFVAVAGCLRVLARSLCGGAVLFSFSAETFRRRVFLHAGVQRGPLGVESCHFVGGQDRVFVAIAAAHFYGKGAGG